MRLLSRSTEDDGGSAAVEFILLGVLLLVPLVYLIVSLGLIQEQSLGVEAGARHLARAVSTAQGPDEAADRTRVVLASVTEEYGLDRDSLALSVGCRPAAADCPSPGVTLIVTLRARVELPLVPSILGIDRMASIPIEATAVHKVSRFWEAS